MKLQRAIIFVKDLPAMTAFYSKMLGVKPVSETYTDSWAEFDIPGAGLALHAIPREIADGIRITSPPEPRTENPVKLSFMVGDLEAETVRLSQLGIALTTRPWGSCDCVDLEGNIFQTFAGPKS